MVGLGYDLQGNVGNRNGQTYDFDYGNRLRTVTGQESYRYDGLGRRVQTTKTDGSKTTLWQYTQSGQMAFSSDWEGATYANQKTHENVYLAGSVVAIIDHDWPSNAVIATKYQHTDALGSPVAVTNAAGTVIERNDYEPYGAVIGKPAYSGIGYTGHVMDGGTGLTYMQQRYYDQSIGSFLSVDPVATDPTTSANFNRFSYANSNPLRFIDPDGRAACPKGSGGMCIDSPRTESGTTVQAAPSQQQRAVDGQVRTASRRGSLSDGTRLNFNGQEQGFKASAEGTSHSPLQPICQRCENGSTREGGVFNVRAWGAEESGGHTHHNNLSGLPGPEDGGLARATARTAYVISGRGAFAIEKTDVGYRIRIIDGVRPTNEERSQMRSTVDAWNQHQGGSGVSCTTTSGGC